MRLFRKPALTKIFLLTISIFYLNVFIVAEESNLYLDLSKIGPIAPKGRVQDKEYNPDLPIIDELIKIGPESISFLVSKLEDKTIIRTHVLDFWTQVRIGDVAWVILYDFFTTSDWRGSTIQPGLGSIYKHYDKDKPGWENWWALIKRIGRKGIREKVERILMPFNHYIWDSKERNFRLKNKSEVK